jgi:glycosyltransferase involved in cell wall biosynthesis
MVGGDGAGQSCAHVVTLSICVPTFERPALLERALRSVIGGTNERADEVEIIVSDDSRDDYSALVCERLFATWRGRAQRIANRPGVGMVENFNRCVSLATGHYILILHDDDYLLPNGLVAVLDSTASGQDQHPVLLFGVDVVDDGGRLRRRQTFTKERSLPPQTALLNVLSNSSYVRFPGMVVRKDAYEAVGPFDVDLGGTTDLDMWIKLFALYGVTCVPRTVSAYTVHVEAHTTGMFNPESIERISRIFERAKAKEILPPETIRRCGADFFAQFILAGAYRQLRVGNQREARRTLALANLPAVRAAGDSPRWLPVWLAMHGLVRAPLPLLTRTTRWLERLSPHTSIPWPR